MVSKKKHTLNLTYYPIFKNVRKIPEELPLLLSSEVSIIGFKNASSLKDHLVRTVLPQLDREGRYKSCEEENRPREVCESIKDAKEF